MFETDNIFTSIITKFNYNILKLWIKNHQFIKIKRI
jgi:hypothetical protein